MLIPVGLTLILAGFLFGERTIDAELKQQWSRGRFRPVLLGAHLLAFALCLGLSTIVFGGELGQAASPALYVLGWLITLAAMLALWVLSMFAANALLALARRTLRPLLVGLLLSLAALGVGQVLLLAWDPLGPATLKLAHFLLTLVVEEPVWVPSRHLLGTPQFTVGIAPICSGYQGIGLVWVFVSAYLWLFRRDLRFPHALLLLPIGTVLIWLANAVRVTVLVLVGHFVSSEIAVQGFHSHAGWLFFCIVVALLILASRHLRWFRGAGSDPAAAEPGAGCASAAYLVPFLVLLATALVTGMFTSGFDILYPVRVLVVVATFWAFRRHYSGLRPSASLGAVSIGFLVFAFWVGWPLLIGSVSVDDRTAEGLAGLPVLLAVSWIAARLLGAVLLIPVAEELAFRGYLLRRLVSADFEQVDPRRFSLLSFLGSSLAYGLLHSDWLTGTAAGMLFAAALYRRGRLGDAVLAHITANALTALYVLGTGDWSAWH